MAKKETDPTPAERGSLYARINAVKAEVGRVPKTGRNQHFGYAFATESDISDCLRELMAKHGVCLLYHGPDKENIVVEEAGETRSGGKKFRAQVWIKYELVNVDDPTQRETVWGYGEALDTEDKGHNKAITNCHKYVMMKAFDVSTGDTADDPDSAGHGDDTIRRPPPPARQSRAQAVAPKNASTPARVPEGEGAPLGASGAKTLFGLMNERGITLKEIRAGLYAMGYKDLLKGREIHPQTWPEGLIPDIKKVIEKHPVVPPQTGPTQIALRQAAVTAWNKQSMSYAPGTYPPSDAGVCAGPDDLLARMAQDTYWNQFEDGDDRRKEMIDSLNGGNIEVLSGSVIPF